ncbi:hypothetical protein AOQ84DRAFT_377077 [Glonium stellatum]|uniref:LIM zinc-binding domain-containing protein n=1 Tax=Glonium stellatum TaxID=574774 RepID=A0A8E2F053_9PEZI|nr:hypothetical protein AOQ84DRAFT_377077 [Glonium stellatum]
MCEPISMLGTALAIVSTAITLGQQTYDMVTGIQEAPDNIKRLAGDLQSLYSVLGLLAHALAAQNKVPRPESIPVHLISNIKELLEKCIDVFGEIGRTVRPFLDSNGNVLRGTWRGFKWEMGKKNGVLGLQRTLSDYKLTLELAISSLNFINSSQTIDMVQHLQKDIRRLRRQVDSRDREERAHRNAHPAQQDTIPNQDPYNLTMRRFLARTESVISSTSTSTRVTDSVFSDELSDVTSVTEYSELRTTDAMNRMSIKEDQCNEDILHETENSSQEPQTDFDLSQRSQESSQERNVPGTGTSFQMVNKPEKTSSWKWLKRRMKKSGDTLSPSLTPVAEVDIYSQPSVTGAMDHAIAPNGSSSMSARPEDTDETFISQSRPTGNLGGMVTQPYQGAVSSVGFELQKSVSVPFMGNLYQEHQRGLRPPQPVPHRSMTTPVNAISLSDQHNPYYSDGLGPRGNQPDEKLSETPAMTDRDALLSSLRRAASKSPNADGGSSAALGKNVEGQDLHMPCKGCHDLIKEEKHYSINSYRWHIRCFRCNICRVALQSDGSTIFFLHDNTLVCNSCGYSCQSCRQRVEEHGAKEDGLAGSFAQIQTLANTPGQLACPGVFFCHECHRGIKNLRYVRTRQGIFCLACHPQTMSEMEQNRRERERESVRAVPVLVS